VRSIDRVRQVPPDQKEKGKEKMNRIMKAAGMVAAVAMVGTTLYAAEASLSLDVASAYVFRGSTFNDGVVLQPGLEVGGLGGLSVGVWGNLDIDDYDGALADGEFSELDIYGSYAVPVEGLDLSIGYTEYAYPSGGGDADRELGVSAGVGVAGVDLGAGVFYGVDGGIEDSLYLELSAGSSFELSDRVGLDLGATVGYMSPDEGEDGFSHYTASVGLNCAAVSAGVTYIGQIDDDVLPDVEDGGSYDAEVVGTIGASIDF
jgi:uncharacterized protein (TIGR02001 family)